MHESKPIEPIEDAEEGTPGILGIEDIPASDSHPNGGVIVHVSPEFLLGEVLDEDEIE